jgi:hypothetical protein
MRALSEGAARLDRTRTVTEAQGIFRPQVNCCATVKAARAAFIVDAQDYYAAFMRAA